MPGAIRNSSGHSGGLRMGSDPPAPRRLELERLDLMSTDKMDKQRNRAIGARVFVIVVSAMILMLAAFGAGLGVGSQLPRQGAAAVMPGGALPSITLSPTLTVNLPMSGTTASPATGKEPLDLKLFSEAYGLLKDQFYGQLPDQRELTYNAIRGMVDHLGDPHTAFVDPEQAALLNSDMEGHFEGIGARVGLAEGGGVRLEYLFPEQPAEKAGLQAGDVVIGVDGKDITHLDLMEAIGLIRGPRDSKVVLTIARDGEKPFDVSVMRARIEIPVVESKTLADGRIGYIALSEFSSVAPQRLADAMQEALAKQLTGLILDLRGNPGGLLDASVRIGSYFVPEGNILIERSKDGKERTYARQGRFLLGKTPLVVLVDGGSASASEIVAGAIQDAGTGKLIGEKTYGKGSVQLPNSLSDGSQLRVTIAHWFTPKDRAINGVGLTPDIQVSLTQADIEAKRDPQLDRAVEYLLQGK